MSQQEVSMTQRYDQNCGQLSGAETAPGAAAGSTS